MKRAESVDCSHCGARIGSRGHRCQTPMCLGTYQRAKNIIAAGRDCNGAALDAEFMAALEYSIQTKELRR